MYKYAVIDNVGKCYRVYNTTNYICEKTHVPIVDYENLVPCCDAAERYLGRYYYPIPQYVDSHQDFVGDWYLDFERQIKVEEVPPEWLKD